jgi:tripartite-type tricarboxylate transporter receptor subunit TctC
MKLPHRRHVLRLAVGAAALPALSPVARAQTYPTRPVRIIVGFTAGSAPDILARLTAQSLPERLGQQFVVENRPGGATNIATEAVVRASPDGYTLLQVTSSNGVNATLYDKLNFNFIRDIAPVASLTLTPQVMEVNPSFPAKTVPEFIAYAKANPGKISLASAGIGSPGHLASELFRMTIGIEMTLLRLEVARPTIPFRVTCGPRKGVERSSANAQTRSAWCQTRRSPRRSPFHARRRARALTAL